MFGWSSPGKTSHFITWETQLEKDESLIRRKLGPKEIYLTVFQEPDDLT